jgi:hypothetical protein
MKVQSNIYNNNLQSPKDIKNNEGKRKRRMIFTEMDDSTYFVRSKVQY